MTARLDEHGLTPKKKMFADEYLKSGNLYRSYLASHDIKKDWKRSSIEKRGQKLIREYPVEAYVKKMQAERAHKYEVDAMYVLNGLKSVVESNYGKQPSVRALELIGKMQGYFWEKPAKKLEGQVDVSNNTRAIEQIVKMLGDGLITEESAAAWLQTIDQKSKVEERENTNKEILEKLNTINSAMEKKDEQT